MHLKRIGEKTMKAQTSGSIILLTLICLLISSCDSKPKKATSNDIAFDSLRVEKTYHLLNNPDNPNCNLQINFTFPVKMDDKSLLPAVSKLFVSSYFGENYETLSPAEAVAKYTEDYLNAYKELEAEYKKELENADKTPAGSWFSYYEMSENEITYNQGGLLCFIVHFENYTGGAHGAHAFHNHVINLATGAYLTEEDIFVDNFQDALAQLLIDKIAEQNHVADPKELENVGFFSIDEIYPNGNFLVDGDGITYTFNEYEIAAYVVGATNVHLSYKELSMLLKKDSPIALLTGN